MMANKPPSTILRGPARIIAILLVFVIGGTAYWILSSAPSAPLRALPASAEDVQEHYVPAFGSDYIRCIKARLPEADFLVYAQDLGLGQRFDPAEFGSKALWPFDPSYNQVPIWWDPPGKEAGVIWFWNRDPDQTLVEWLTWSKGYVYYMAFSW